MVEKTTKLFIVQIQPETKRIFVESEEEMLKQNRNAILSKIAVNYIVVGIAESEAEAVEIASEFESQLQKANLLPKDESLVK